MQDVRRRRSRTGSCASSHEGATLYTTDAYTPIATRTASRISTTPVILSIVNWTARRASAALRAPMERETARHQTTAIAKKVTVSVAVVETTSSRRRPRSRR